LRPDKILRHNDPVRLRAFYLELLLEPVKNCIIQAFAAKTLEVVRKRKQEDCHTSKIVKRPRRPYIDAFESDNEDSEAKKIQSIDFRKNLHRLGPEWVSFFDEQVKNADCSESKVYRVLALVAVPACPQILADLGELLQSEASFHTPTSVLGSMYAAYLKLDSKIAKS